MSKELGRKPDFARTYQLKMNRGSIAAVLPPASGGERIDFPPYRTDLGARLWNGPSSWRSIGHQGQRWIVAIAARSRIALAGLLPRRGLVGFLRGGVDGAIDRVGRHQRAFCAEVSDQPRANAAAKGAQRHLACRPQNGAVLHDEDAKREKPDEEEA